VHREQRAIIELYSGRILITDLKRPFSPDQHREWSRESCVTELRSPRGHGMKRFQDFWVTVDPVNDGTAHYQVRSSLDLQVLRTECQVDEVALRYL
jgi:hypothetical protein